MLKSKNFIYRIAFTVLVMVTVHFAIRLPGHEPSAITPSFSTLEKREAKSPFGSVAPPAAEKIPEAAGSESANLVPGTAAYTAVLNEYKQWIEDHGYFDIDKVSDYAEYDEKTLINLANGGDLKAITLLGDRALNNGDMDKSRYYCELAAVRGSTSAIDSLAIFSEPSQFNKYSSEAEKNKAYYETLAYAAVAEMRGDKFAGSSHRKSVVSSSHLNLSAEDYDAINKRAQEIYDDFQAKRIQLGLVGFENTVPVAYK